MGQTDTIDNILRDFQHHRDFVNERLHAFLANENPLLDTLHEAISYSLHSGGKRIRPLFCLSVGELFGLSREKLTSIACAVEMIHTASLIMDDLPHMDDAKLRRGKPANHVVYG
jgi:geranylgeranyl diphosphate synthase type II